MWVVGSVPSLGCWAREKALRMARDATGAWVTSFPQSHEAVRYRYFLTGPGGVVVWASGRLRDCPNEYGIVDSRTNILRIVDAVSADEPLATAADLA